MLRSLGRTHGFNRRVHIFPSVFVFVVVLLHVSVSKSTITSENRVRYYICSSNTAFRLVSLSENNSSEFESWFLVSFSILHLWWICFMRLKKVIWNEWKISWSKGWIRTKKVVAILPSTLRHVMASSFSSSPGAECQRTKFMDCSHDCMFLRPRTGGTLPLGTRGEQGQYQ